MRKETPVSFGEDLKKAIGKALDDPSAFLHLTCVVLLALSFVAVLGGWTLGVDLKIPQVLFGIMTMLLLLLNSQKMSTTGGIGLILALGLVGTIIAREDFIIRIMHMWRGQPAALSEYLQASGAEVKPLTPARDIKEEVLAIVRQELKIPLKPETEKRIEKVVEQAEVERVADRVKRVPNFVLRSITKEGKDAAARLVRQYGTIEDFNKDMRLLQREGVFKCEKEDLSTCEATDLGKKVADIRDRPLPKDKPDQKPIEPTSKKGN